ncbi:TPA: hypothetical protein ACGPAW_000980 [Streptococcus suis]|uniref:Membrane protein n=1 Tax=Streptococcus suis TaxID=1307 RepID=A0A116QXZ1_STRSU|nr:hypothetical protein [Streptococcus suis]MBL1126183.1 hypothetical protein [Streptococcus suis]MBY4989596.1 hypothetical protein [Streptococcus suis]NQM04708.1 hypothetical protein [Streptococcus suis]NQR95436.1 hypothetical protein [Streptococcus suis]CYX37692.1 membrane protein [Streptococcus suis]
MEKRQKTSWKVFIPAIIVILFMYAGMYLIAFHLVSDTMVSKGLVVGNILIYTPVVLFFLGLVYGLFKGFSIWLLILVFLLYPVTIFFFQEWILLYQLAYTFCALIGNGLGALLFSLRKKMMKNP